MNAHDQDTLWNVTDLHNVIRSVFGIPHEHRDVRVYLKGLVSIASPLQDDP